jgi:hydrogenase maturation protease
MIKILGLGNVCMSDDGFGPYVVRTFDAMYEVPASVHVIDAGTPGLDLARYLASADLAILIDIVAAAGAPGDVHVYSADDLLKASSEPLTHDPSIGRALEQLAEDALAPKQVILLGVVPEWIATGVTLSAPVRAAVAPIVSLIVTELERHGVTPAPRAVPRHADTWWERAVTAG